MQPTSMRAPFPTSVPMRHLSQTQTFELLEENLTTHDLDDLRRDPETIALAPPMPLSLVTPMDVPASMAEAAFSPEGNAWGIEAVKAHLSPFDGAGVSIAVLDTGIKAEHPAFAGVELLQKNFTTESSDDLIGHGTHCAGTIFGRNSDGKRIGVARGIQRALVGKVLGEGGGSSATLSNAINWAVENGANIISMSLGIDFPGYVEYLVTQRGLKIEPATSMALSAYRANINLFSNITELLEARSSFGAGAIIIAASGNESKRPNYRIAVSPPAAGNGMISVGALEQGADGFATAYFSNSECNCCAPGVNIVSASHTGGLIAKSGTSMATPHVAGIAALWAQKSLLEVGAIATNRLANRILGQATQQELSADSQLIDVGIGLVQAPQ